MTGRLSGALGDGEQAAGGTRKKSHAKKITRTLNPTSSQSLTVLFIYLEVFI